MKRGLPTACVVVLAMLLVPPWSVAGQAEPAPLDARLGGTTESFEEKYGEPVEAEGSPVFTEYKIRGYSTVFAASREGRIDNVTLFSPRPEGEEWINDEPHERDWSVRKAHELAARFLPRDAELEDPADEQVGVIQTVGFSQALAEEVPESVYAYVDNEYVVGQCSYVLMLNVDKSGVNHIVVSLLVEEPLP